MEPTCFDYCRFRLRLEPTYPCQGFLTIRRDIQAGISASPPRISTALKNLIIEANAIIIKTQPLVRLVIILKESIYGCEAHQARPLGRSFATEKSGGGGCSLNLNQAMPDPTLPVLVAFAGLYLLHRRLGWKA